MTQGSIENPVINSPFVEPAQHFVTTADGTVTGEIEPRRRPSEFFVPVARPKKLSGQLTLGAFGGPKRQQPNEIVNEIRQAVARGRIQDYPHVTSTTRALLERWRDEDRERRLFVCQLEAAETAIYLTEAAETLGHSKALNVSGMAQWTRAPVSSRRHPPSARSSPGPTRTPNICSVPRVCEQYFGRPHQAGDLTERESQAPHWRPHDDGSPRGGFGGRCGTGGCGTTELAGDPRGR